MRQKTIRSAKVNIASTLAIFVFWSICSYPNPFKVLTTLKYTVTDDSDVNIDIYNIKGQIVKNWRLAKQKSGEHSLIWDGKDNQGTQSSSGIYFIRVNTKQGYKTIKNVMIK